MPESVMLIASAKIPAEKKNILAGPKSNFPPHPITPHQPTIKVPLKSKNLPPPHRFSTHSSQYQN